MEKSQYDTFDSGGGPINPSPSETDHNDSAESLQSGYTSNKADMEHGAIPEVPTNKH